MKTSHRTSALVLGAAILTLSVGGALAAVTTDGDVNLMAGPGTHFKTIARLQANTNVSIVGMNRAWCEISSVSAKGWVSCSDLNGAPASRVNTAPAANTSYDFQGDPVLGPTVPGGLHTLYNGESH